MRAYPVQPLGAASTHSKSALHAGSAQSTLPSPSLSMPSVQSSGPPPDEEDDDEDDEDEDDEDDEEDDDEDDEDDEDDDDDEDVDGPPAPEPPVPPAPPGPLMKTSKSCVQLATRTVSEPTANKKAA